MSNESQFAYWNSPNWLKKSTSQISFNAGILDTYLGRGASTSVGTVLSNTSGYIHIASLNLIEVYLRVIDKTEYDRYDRFNCQYITTDANLGTVLSIGNVHPLNMYTSPDSSDYNDPLSKLVFTGFQTSDINIFDMSGVSTANKKSYRMGFYGSYYPIDVTYQGKNWKAYRGDAYFTQIVLNLDEIATRLGVDVSDLADGIAKSDGVPSDWEYADNGEPYGGTDEGGEYEDYESEDVDAPDTPSTSISATGFINVYSIGQNGLTSFGSELFPDITLQTPTSPSESLLAIAEGITNIANNIVPMIRSYINQTLINYVLDCHVVPYPPANVESNIQHVKVAWKEFSATADKQNSDYSSVDCGTLAVPEKYKSFLDYLTRVKLFLPFIGFVDISPTYCMGGALSVTYMCNIIDGSCMATVKATNGHGLESATVVGQYSGNCIIHTPITGAAYGSVVSGLASAVTQGVSGSISGAVGSAINAVTQLPSTPSSNGYSASSGFLGCRTPFLLIETAVAQYPKKYLSLKGKPSNIYTRCDKLVGFTEASASRCLNPSGLTAPEISAVLDALGEGCIFPDND